MAFLYDNLISEFGKRALAEIKVPNHIVDNLKHSLRPYQEESFRRFALFYNEDFDGKPNKPYHLLYNMATGSGKTLVMAGLMLELYEKGYRNFLFFVDSNNIIDKTKDNFLNQHGRKYLFEKSIVVNGREVLIKEVHNLEEADHENINIIFTTIQQLHLNLNNTKEGSVTYEDFKDKKIVLIADEAHHINAGTKQGNLLGSWERTVINILQQNIHNILLEFTATLEYESAEIAKKYENKVLQRYDLAQFRLDKYSKEINLIRSLYDERDRIVQALILNLYREELAASHNINLKPVILFKAKKTIKESEENKVKFHALIDDFSADIVEHIKATSTIPVVQKAFSFFSSKKLSSTEIAQRIKYNFREENCISANNDQEAGLNQIRLNTLEDENNPIRAVFAVQKLNEGWDVLNLFDIVRLYESRDGKAGVPGKTTIAESQLIGRGARYFPFTLSKGQDKYTRKYDNDISNDLKILEELYYHTKEDSRYIAELKKALIESGIYEDEENLVTKELILKQSFKETELYKTGKVVFNNKIPKSYRNIKSFSDLGVSRRNFNIQLSSGMGRESNMFTNEESVADTLESNIQKDILLSMIPSHVIRFALSQNPFFSFDNLIRFFPNIESLSTFITNREYLGGLEITFSGPKSKLENLTNLDYLQSLQKLLKDIESDIKTHLTEYEGSNFTYDYIRNVFKNKLIKVQKDSERARGQEELLHDATWYAYNANYGTLEEKEFVNMFARRLQYLNNQFKNIYLIRNERELKIFDEYGKAFEPDFILFCQQKIDSGFIY
jgi:type III restriction enzyme